MLFKPPLGWADTLAMKIDGLLQNVCAEFSVFCPLLKNTRRIHAGSRYNSGHPFNLLAGSDINGDGHFTNDRPPGAGRNSGIGPNYVSFDMRLSKSFRFGENTALQFTAEGFNITNRTNYATVNNIVGATLVPPFNVQGTASLSPSQPLGFTSALAKREIQLGARLTF